MLPGINNPTRRFRIWRWTAASIERSWFESPRPRHHPSAMSALGQNRKCPAYSEVNDRRAIENRPMDQQTGHPRKAINDMSPRATEPRTAVQPVSVPTHTAVQRAAIPTRPRMMCSVSELLANILAPQRIMYSRTSARPRCSRAFTASRVSASDCAISLIVISSTSRKMSTCR